MAWRQTSNDSALVERPTAWLSEHLRNKTGSCRQMLVPTVSILVNLELCATERKNLVIPCTHLLAGYQYRIRSGLVRHKTENATYLPHHSLTVWRSLERRAIAGVKLLRAWCHWWASKARPPCSSRRQPWVITALNRAKNTQPKAIFT